MEKTGVKSAHISAIKCDELIFDVHHFNTLTQVALGGVFLC